MEYIDSVCHLIVRVTILSVVCSVMGKWIWDNYLGRLWRMVRARIIIMWKARQKTREEAGFAATNETRRMKISAFVRRAEN